MQKMYITLWTCCISAQLTGADGWDLHAHLCSCLWTNAGQGNQVTNLILTLVLQDILALILVFHLIIHHQAWWKRRVQTSDKDCLHPGPRSVRLRKTTNSRKIPEITGREIILCCKTGHIWREAISPPLSVDTTDWQEQMYQIEYVKAACIKQPPLPNISIKLFAL